MTTPEQIFKDAWNDANARGELGSRVTAGLEALRIAGYLVESPAEEKDWCIKDSVLPASSYNREKSIQIARERLVTFTKQETGQTFDTLGDVASVLREMKSQGATKESLIYVVDKVWYE